MRSRHETCSAIRRLCSVTGRVDARRENLEALPHSPCRVLSAYDIFDNGRLERLVLLVYARGSIKVDTHETPYPTWSGLRFLFYFGTDG